MNCDFRWWKNRPQSAHNNIAQTQFSRHFEVFCFPPICFFFFSFLIERRNVATKHIQKCSKTFLLIAKSKWLQTHKSRQRQNVSEIVFESDIYVCALFSDIFLLSFGLSINMWTWLLSEIKTKRTERMRKQDEKNWKKERGRDREREKCTRRNFVYIVFI